MSAFTPTSNTGSQTVTAQATDQVLIQQNLNRKYFEVQNTDTVNLYVNFGAPAYTGSAYSGFVVYPGGMLIEWGVNGVPNSTVHVASSKTGHVFTIMEGV